MHSKSSSTSAPRKFAGGVIQKQERGAISDYQVGNKRARVAHTDLVQRKQRAGGRDRSTAHGETKGASGLIFQSVTGEIVDARVAEWGGAASTTSMLVSEEACKSASEGPSEAAFQKNVTPAWAKKHIKNGVRFLKSVLRSILVAACCCSRHPQSQA